MKSWRELIWLRLHLARDVNMLRENSPYNTPKRETDNHARRSKNHDQRREAHRLGIDDGTRRDRHAGERAGGWFGIQEFRYRSHGSLHDLGHQSSSAVGKSRIAAAIERENVARYPARRASTQNRLSCSGNAHSWPAAQGACALDAER